MQSGVPSGFVGRIVSEMYTGCIFSWGTLAAATLEEDKTGAGGARAGVRCELGLVVLTALSGKGMRPEGLEQEPRGLGFSPA